MVSLYSLLIPRFMLVRGPNPSIRASRREANILLVSYQIKRDPGALRRSRSRTLAEIFGYCPTLRLMRFFSPRLVCSAAVRANSPSHPFRVNQSACGPADGGDLFPGICFPIRGWESSQSIRKNSREFGSIIPNQNDGE